MSTTASPDDLPPLSDLATGVRRLARGLVAEDRVDDLVQEAMLAFLTHSGRIRRGVRAWLAGVARNLARHGARSDARRRARETNRATLAPAPSAVEIAARLEQRTILLRLVAALPEPSRTAVWLRFFEGLTPREIAARTGVPVETAKSRIRRGLARLRETLDRRHGGDRSEWLGALLPLGMARRLLIGGLVVKKTLTVAAVLLALFALGGALYLLPGEGRKGPAAPSESPETAPAARGTEDFAVPAPAETANAGDAEAESGARKAPGPSESAVPPPSEAPSPVAAPVRGGAPAIRPNPRVPPPPKPGSRSIGGGRGSVGPTGGWSRFAPVPPRGPAAITVKVTDRDGVAVPGADVYLGPPETAGQAAVSFGHLRGLGKTGVDGTVTAKGLPEGRAGVAANLAGLLNGPRGLDARTAVLTVLGGGTPAAAEVRLPFAISELGSIRGRVTGPDGGPVAHAQVMCGYCRVYAGADGSYELPHVMKGSHTVSVSRTGLRPASRAVDLAGGATVDLDFELAYAEAGSLALSGTVVGPEGEPVADATVYLMARMGLGTGTVRTVRSDAHGAFRMESLPDRLATTGVRLQANATGYRPANQSWDAGLPTGAVELRLPERLVRLTLSVLDGPTGGPLDRCRFSATKAGADRAAASFSSASPTGVYVTWLSAGSLEFLVEAPDHEPLRATVEVGPPGAEMSWTARLVPTGPAEVEVSLTVKLSDSATGEPVKAARIEVLSGETKEPVEALDTRRDDGVYLLPAPSGKHRLRVTAPGYEPYEDAIEIARDAPAVTREVRLVRLR